MVERLEQIDPKILYASLLIIIALAMVIHLTSDKTHSIMSLFLIVVIALGNIGYLHRKFKRT